MTTLIALATKHAVVIGADSLGTATRRYVSPFVLMQYFDAQNNYKLKMKADGTPELEDFGHIFNESEQLPYNQLLHVNKFFKLGELPIAVMFSGILSIGDHTIRGLVSSFVENDKTMKRRWNRSYTVEDITNGLLKSLREYYIKEFPKPFLEEELEILVAGYDKSEQRPTIFRINVKENEVECEFPPGEYGVAFGGQTDWIQRIVFGTDIRNRVKLEARSREQQNLYREKMAQKLASCGYTGDLPKPEDFGDELRLFHGDWELDRLEVNWGDFSEQNAIDAVSFFLRIMINAQDVSAQLPTVGGGVHIAVIRKDGFHAVTKEVWTHEGHEVDVPEVGK